MNKFLKWLGIEDAFNRGVISRVLIILCLLFTSFGGVFLITRVVQALHPAYSPPHWTDVLLEIILFVCGSFALWLIRAGKMRSARRVILGTLLIAVTLQVYFVGDPTNDIVGAMGLQLFGILAILLLDRRDRWIAIALVVIVFIGLSTLSTTGYLTPVVDQDPLGKTIFSIFVWLSVSVIITVVIFTALNALRREPQLIEQQIIGAVQAEKNGTSKQSIPYLSTHDSLTGLYNRLFFETELNRMEKSRRYPISIIMAVVDNLKTTNDQITDYNDKQSNLSVSLSMGTSTAQQGDSLKNHLRSAEKQMRQENSAKAESGV